MKFATLLNFVGSIFACIALILVVYTTVDPAAYPNQLTREEILMAPPSLPVSLAKVNGEGLDGHAEGVYLEVVQQGEQGEQTDVVTSLSEQIKVASEVVATPLSVAEATEEIEIAAEAPHTPEPIQSVNEEKEVHEIPVLEVPEPVQDDQNRGSAVDAKLPVLADLFLDSEQADVQPASKFSLPKAKVNTEIIQIPIEDGSWALDDLDDEVGILQGGGEFPGDDYSMIFAGHVTTRWPILGPFGRLKNFSLGDEVVYQDGEHIFTYEITRFIYAHPSRVDLLFQQERDQIVMVTCNGYDLLTDTFSKRLVSYATLMKVTSIDAPDIALSLDPFR